MLGFTFFLSQTSGVVACVSVGVICAFWVHAACRICLVLYAFCNMSCTLWGSARFYLFVTGSWCGVVCVFCIVFGLVLFEILKGLLLSVAALASSSASWTDDNANMFAVEGGRFFTLVYVGETYTFVHCRTLTLWESHGWECHVVVWFRIEFSVFSLHSFCLQLTPPVIDKKLGKYFSNQHIE